MHVSIVTVFPQLYDEFLKTSLIKRAQQEGRISFDVAGFSSFCVPKERIDGPTVGHGTGMALRPEVIERAVVAQEYKFGKAVKIFVTPQGEKLTQRTAKKLSHIIQTHEHVMFFAGRYEGIDARAQSEYATYEISIGDYVLMGGDLPVMVILEACLRYIPGIVARAESVEKDSFSTAFVDFPTYTVPPREWKGHVIPEILLSGNHAAMNQWRQEKAAELSVKNHFEWVRSYCVHPQERALAARFIPSHYVALLHDQVIVQQTTVGTSSVTSIDIHDIARSSKTFGIKEYFVVTPLKDQQIIVQTMLDFWHKAGIEYNESRSQAVQLVTLSASLAHAIEIIEKKEGKKPLIIGTSARPVDGIPMISYRDQQEVWKHNKPILFIFGTAKGISTELLASCDYLLMPVEGFYAFNHLSVRSAVAIILDRWLGINLIKTD